MKTEDWEPDEELQKENDEAYDVLLPLRNTELAGVPARFEPLSSKDSRGKVCTMGNLVCSLLRAALNIDRRQREVAVDAVLLMGGNIRGGTDYEPGSFFSMEALEAEIKSDETIAIIEMPGWLLAEGVQATHAGDPIPGWMQYDVGVQEEFFDDGRLPVVTHVGFQPLDRDRTYRVATKIGDLTNGQSPPWTEYYKTHPEVFPAKGAYINIHAELMGYFARNLWRKIWDQISPDKAEPCDIDNEECDPEGRLATLDLDEDGVVGVHEIHAALRDVLELSVDESELSLSEFVHTFADTDNDGLVTIKDFQVFCEEMPQVYQTDAWRLLSTPSATTAKT